MKIVTLNEENKERIIRELTDRSPETFEEQEKAVRAILADVRSRGDEALLAYTEKFDGVRLTPATMEVSEAEICEAYDRIDPVLPEIIRKALVHIRDYHQKQKRNSWLTTTEEGTMLGMRILPMERIGVYVPGGKAAYPSSVLMNIVPARVAGVDEIVMTTPCGPDGSIEPAVLVAAREAGADRIFKAGGAQAVAALTYGTETVPKVDKIVGPGNIYVALAKKEVFGSVSIDSVAGPSEILVLADRKSVV